LRRNLIAINDAKGQRNFPSNLRSCTIRGLVVFRVRRPSHRAESARFPAALRRKSILAAAAKARVARLIILSYAGTRLTGRTTIPIGQLGVLEHARALTNIAVSRALRRNARNTPRLSLRSASHSWRPQPTPDAA
jgi:hypothetical protein